MKFWVPIEVNQLSYLTIYIWQSFIILYFCVIDSNSDLVFIEFIENACIKLKILSYHLEHFPDVIKSAQIRKMKNLDRLLVEKKILRSFFIQHQLIYELVHFVCLFIS